MTSYQQTVMLLTAVAVEDQQKKFRAAARKSWREREYYGKAHPSKAMLVEMRKLDEVTTEYQKLEAKWR